MFEHWLVSAHSLTFDILLHLGTLGAVLFLASTSPMSRQMMLKIVIASLPLVGGVLLKDSIESLRGSLVPLIITYATQPDSYSWRSSSPSYTGSDLVAGIATLHRWLTRQEQPSGLQAFLVGIFQLLACCRSVSFRGQR